MPTHRIHGKRIQALPLHSLPYFRSRMPTLERSAMPLKNRCSVCSLYLVGNVARFYETKKFLFTNCPEAFLCPKWLRLSFRPVLILNDQVRKSFLLRRNWPKSRRNLQTYKPNFLSFLENTAFFLFIHSLFSIYFQLWYRHMGRLNSHR